MAIMATMMTTAAIYHTVLLFLEASLDILVPSINYCR